ncbi:MAG: aminomethyl-transferring glycine dehydrogenase [Bdellovibrionales bacterium]|jgi:glycine dehydrogenase|nr:aminomethyl-transferring glycine dehydrogenase [Bdellovibrionales bacterium]
MKTRANRPSFSVLESRSDFSTRHIGPRATDLPAMLKQVGADSVDQLIDQTVPKAIRSQKSLDLPEGQTEAAVLARAWELASSNKVFKSFLGQGYHGTFTPPVILRNILENPGWYTAYTPYQAEISQGRLEAILNFQTMVMELTGMAIANASLLDEGTAAAEAMTMARQLSGNVKNDGSGAKTFFVADTCHPQTIEVVTRRAEPLGLNIVVTSPDRFSFSSESFGCLLQYPDTRGAVATSLDSLKAFTEKAHAAKNFVVVAADPLALTLLEPPSEWGADICVGSTQRFGVPMGFGGPHAAYFATRDEYKRSIPGRLVGVSVDSNGRPALRLALQTREQHIRREKATSNICTAQVLLAVMASMYAVYHGPEGLKRIAARVNRLASAFASGLEAGGVKIESKAFFDTVVIPFADQAKAATVLKAALDAGMNLRTYTAGSVVTDKNITALGVSFDELSSRDDVETLVKIFTGAKASFDDLDTNAPDSIPEALGRKKDLLPQKVFNTFHSESEMLRYLKRLENKDLSLAHSMIPLGSCTMKLNSTTEMIPVTWPEMGGIHPFAPVDQAKGYLGFVKDLSGWLSEITGFAGFSLQPNAGSAGEYAGLLTIRDYHISRGDAHRNICLIPSSAHGTNPASAVMAGMKVVVVACDTNGNVDVSDLKAKATQHSANLAALMVTYPSTHGVFEEAIQEICEIVHSHGGQVYMDGANFNAMVGLCRPGEFGPDVSHLNLHKTFCIPHGGGGPGVGPIGVREHLKAFLPGHKGADNITGLRHDNSAVASAPFGSASILPISWSYIALMGRDGLKQATEAAILNANYIAARLKPHYPILYTGKNGRVAHECILDLRDLKVVSVEDVAKRLMDFGFHAPTMSWPVIGTLMVEPTESESKEELDRFCDAMIKIREEIRAVEDGRVDATNNVLKQAPHTAELVTGSAWDRAYTREEAAYPLSWVRERKFWPAVGRVNNVHGDRNLVCSCAPLESYLE